ncbi:MAG: hypothetical protein Q8R50_04130, partial [Sediminibacterium sp.]|nr:hypothetical protein [Sediminibacterium sp.]
MVKNLQALQLYLSGNLKQQLLREICEGSVEITNSCQWLAKCQIDDDTQTGGGYGLMFKRVAQQVVSQAVVDRMNSIANIAPTSWFNTFKVQTISNAFGSSVNCDYFPVHITSLPTGMTVDNFLEYFRTHINQFIDQSIGVSFSPYSDGSFSDAAQFNLSYEQSIGALVHLNLINDGTVVESGYYRNATSVKSRFTFSTISSPLDYAHPVSGNREFGIFTEPNN